MLYLSKPHGTYTVEISTHSQGAYDIYKLRPGATYAGGKRPEGDFVAERDHLPAAKQWADTLDLTMGPNPCPMCDRVASRP